MGRIELGGVIVCTRDCFMCLAKTAVEGRDVCDPRKVESWYLRTRSNCELKRRQALGVAKVQVEKNQKEVRTMLRNLGLKG